jgi:aryl sulfotransferase
VRELVEYRTGIADNRRWERFEFRPGDVVIASPAKSGTTWTQLLVALIIFDGSGFPDSVAAMSPWLDMTIRSEEAVFDTLARQSHRRFIKTHTPLDGLPLVDDVHYVCVGRDPRDAVISMTHHLNNLDWDRALDVARDMGGELDTDHPEEPLPPDYFLRGWVDANAEELWPLEKLLHHYRCQADNLYLDGVDRFHFSDYHRDLPGSIQRLAAHLGVSLDAGRARRLAAHATIDRVRTDAAQVAPDGHLGIWKKPDEFFRSGAMGEWRELLTTAEVEIYERRVAELIEPELADWIHHGDRR